jgi:hypothetical protein
MQTDSVAKVTDVVFDQFVKPGPYGENMISSGLYTAVNIRFNVSLG